MTELRALTIRQPWCWAVVVDDSAAKHVENRSPGAASWKYRGRLLLHSAKGWSNRGASDRRIVDLARRHGVAVERGPIGPCHHNGRPHSWEPGEWCPPEAPRLERLLQDPTVFPLGDVLGDAELVDIHPDTGCCRPWGESSYTEGSGAKAKKVHEVTHLVLEDVHRLVTPLPARGALGLWKPDPDLIDAVKEQMTA